jgi:hypothetical protein
MAARQVEIDVRPARAALAEEALKEELACDGVHIRDVEAVADGAVGRATSPLCQDALGAAKTDDVPDNKEVTCKAELFDDAQFMVELLFHIGRDGSIAHGSAVIGDLSQQRVLRFALTCGIGGKGVAQIFQAKLEALDELLLIRDGLGDVSKEAMHGACCLQMTLGVLREEKSGLIEMRVMPQAGEGIVQHPSGGLGVAGTIAGQQGETKCGSEVDELSHTSVLAGESVALDLDINMVRAKTTHEALHPLHGLRFIFGLQQRMEPPLFVTREGREACRDKSPTRSNSRDPGLWPRGDLSESGG